MNLLPLNRTYAPSTRAQQPQTPPELGSPVHSGDAVIDFGHGNETHNSGAGNAVNSGQTVINLEHSNETLIYSAISTFIDENFPGIGSNEKNSLVADLNSKLSSYKLSQVKPVLLQLKQVIDTYSNIPSKIDAIRTVDFHPESRVETLRRNLFSESVLMNAARDFLWGGTTELGLSYSTDANNKAALFLDQTITQAGISMVGISTVGLLYQYFTADKNIFKSICTALGADLAIFPWNYVQLSIAQALENNGFTPQQAAYLSGVFGGPGLVEGPIQSIAATIGDLPHSLRNVDFTTSFYNLLKTITFGALPGNIWQLAAQASKDIFLALNITNPIARFLFSGFLVSVAVGIANVGFSTYMECRGGNLPLTISFPKKPHNDIEAPANESNLPPNPNSSPTTFEIITEQL